MRYTIRDPTVWVAHSGPSISDWLSSSSVDLSVYMTTLRVCFFQDSRIEMLFRLRDRKSSKLVPGEILTAVSNVRSLETSATPLARDVSLIMYNLLEEKMYEVVRNTELP